MAFATRADLLARSNARRLGHLAVPADMPMPPDDALRVAIAGGDLTGYTADQQTSLAAALEAIDDALADADELIVSYGIPVASTSKLLTRLAAVIAMYYLAGTESGSEETRKAYEGAVGTLKAHARGELNLVPFVPDPAAPAPTEDIAVIESAPSRYDRSQIDGDW
jgi:phage gp36-like protein